MTNGYPPNAPFKSEPVQIDENVLVKELGHDIFRRKYTSEHKIREIGIEKYMSNGNGITFGDIVERFPVKKPQAQRSLKHFTKETFFLQLKTLYFKE
jgi:hypothetical protein